MAISSSLRMLALLACTGAGTVLGLGMAAAEAQSAAQITKALMPTGPLSDTTRGIKPIGPNSGNSTDTRPAPRAAADATNTISTRNAQGHPAIDLNVVFATGSAELTPRAQATLNELGKALTGQALQADAFKIVGHTDTVGTPAGNQTLSAARAEAVKTYLEDKFGIPAGRLQAQGVGEAEPIVRTPPQTANARNRRVQVINVSG